MAWTGSALSYPPCQDCKRIIGPMPTAGLTHHDRRKGVTGSWPDHPARWRTGAWSADTPKRAWPRRWALIAPRSAAGNAAGQLPQRGQRPDLAHKLGVTLEQLD